MTLPWRSDTTEDIAAEADSRYETPGGAQNKVNISQEYLLNLLKLAVTGLSDGSEAAIARHSDPYDITYDWLKDRLDASETRFKNLRVINVLDFGAKGDGITDDRLAIQNAIDYCSAQGGGVVICPATLTGYKIKSGLELKRFVSLEGYFLMQGDKYLEGMDNISGTTFIVDFGGGTSTGQAIMMYTGSQVKNIKFYYPNQSKISSIIIFPPTIRLFPNGGNECSIENVFLTNSYVGIDATGAHERLTIRNLRGQPIIGVKIDANFDVDRLDDIHFYPYWSQDTSNINSYAGFVLYNGVGIEINRADNIQLSGIFVYGYKNGLHLKSNSYGTLTNSGFDFCYRCIQVDEQGINGNGWYVSNTIFIAADYERTDTALGINIEGTTNAMGGLHLTNCGFWSGINGAGNIVGNKGEVVVNGCRFNSWIDQSIYVFDKLKLQVIGCIFKQSGTHISYDVTADSGAIVIGTRSSGGLTVYNPNSLTQQLSANADI